MSSFFIEQKFTSLKKWCKQWSLYQYSRQSGVNNNPKFYKFTELEDCRHEYLRLWMSGVFNDSRFTILNKWSQQWYQYQHSRQSGVNNNSKFYNIYWVRGLQARISTIMNEWFLQWPQVCILNRWSQQWYQYQHSRQSGSIITQNSITFTELDNCRHDYLRLWMSGFFNDQSLQFWIRGVNNDTIINILDKVESIITPNSINLLS